MSGQADFSAPISPGLDDEVLAQRLGARLGLVRDERCRAPLCLLCPATKLRDAVRLLRDEPSLRFTTLLDIAGIDYLSYPSHRAERFAVVYLFKSMFLRHRLALKVVVDEPNPEIPSIHDLYRNADWAERETWDQFGIVFAGHPNLKRLLNHHEFVGHPLRKDYPCQQRQKLSLNDPMIDQLEARLTALGYTVVERGEIHSGQPLTGPVAEVAP
jgi:NADH-quinone oxidoreductase subunit C